MFRKGLSSIDLFVGSEHCVRKYGVPDVRALTRLALWLIQQG